MKVMTNTPLLVQVPTDTIEAAAKVLIFSSVRLWPHHNGSAFATLTSPWPPVRAPQGVGGATPAPGSNLRGPFQLAPGVGPHYHGLRCILAAFSNLLHVACARSPARRCPSAPPGHRARSAAPAAWAWLERPISTASALAPPTPARTARAAHSPCHSPPHATHSSPRRRARDRTRSPAPHARHALDGASPTHGGAPFIGVWRQPLAQPASRAPGRSPSHSPRRAPAASPYRHARDRTRACCLSHLPTPCVSPSSS